MKFSLRQLIGFVAIAGFVTVVALKSYEIAKEMPKIRTAPGVYETEESGLIEILIVGSLAVVVTAVVLVVFGFLSRKLFSGPR